MCGITGIWHWHDVPVKKDRLQQFTAALEHRGPNGEGIYVNPQGKLGLGHRRLSILDPTERGHQPMHYANKRYWLTFNGEIFNFIELKNRLQKKGHAFKSDCDSEVILAAYHHWGAKCLKQFNGMWAFALWDNVEQELFLARDRYGIKPLYFAQQDATLAFASETYAFNFLEDFSKKIHKAKLSRCISNPRSLEGHGHTIYENIFQLLPGHFLKLKKRDSLQQKCWWKWPEPGEAPNNLSYNNQVEKFKTLFTDACKIRMRSDVPIASALSGGMDSSSVYCTLHHLKNKNLLDARIPKNWQKAFVASFPNTSQDETKFAREVVKYTNGEAEFVEPDQNNAIKGWMESTLKYDSIAGSPNFVISSIYKSMSQQGFKVSMDGHGVDEMMFGYHEMVAQAKKVAEDLHQTEFSTELAEILYSMSDIPNRSRIANGGIKEVARKLIPKRIRSILRRFRNSKILPTPTNWLKMNPHFELENLSDQERRLDIYDPFERIVVENFYLDTLPKILKNFDRASMQNGVEIRMPFMDWHLVEFIFSLPVSSKVGNKYTKRILRDAMKPILPEVIRKRTSKIGFVTPMDKWFSNELSEPILDFVHSKDFLESDIWKGEKIRDFVISKTINSSWTMNDGFNFWPFLNAYILINKS